MPCTFFSTFLANQKAWFGLSPSLSSITMMLPVMVWDRFKAVGLGTALLSEVPLSKGPLRAGGTSIGLSIRSFGTSTNPMCLLAVNNFGGSNGTVIATLFYSFEAMCKEIFLCLNQSLSDNWTQRNRKKFTGHLVLTCLMCEWILLFGFMVYPFRGEV
mmetsp:Transcript_40513/g.97782  ORF Transcript_40513/g.97782 Transcript_40513/m.97782 type:complete len:158 (-) Transcript_40513:111-584(-)